MEGGTAKGYGFVDNAIKTIQGELQNVQEKLRGLLGKHDMLPLRNVCVSTLQSLETTFARLGLVEIDIETRNRGMLLREENLMLKEEVFNLKKKMWEDERDRSHTNMGIHKREHGTMTDGDLDIPIKIKGVLEDLAATLDKKAAYITGYFDKIGQDLRDLKTKEFSSSMFLLLLEKVRIYKGRSEEKFETIKCKLTIGQPKKHYREERSTEFSDEDTPAKLIPCKRNVFDRHESREPRAEGLGDQLKRRLIEKRVSSNNLETVLKE